MNDDILERLSHFLMQKWDYGRNVVLAWHLSIQDVAVLFMPVSGLAAFLAEWEHYLTGSRHGSLERLHEMAAIFGGEPVYFPLSGAKLDRRAAQSLVERHAIRRVASQASFLLDISNFSVYSPIERVVQLCDLQAAINWAQHQLAVRGCKAKFSRSTTGDGFYVWAEEPDFDDDVSLFHLLLLVLADAGMRYGERGVGKVIPQLKSCFHMGSCFHFHQAENGSPAPGTYIVGDLTINLERMMSKALPGQMVIGQFSRHVERQGELGTRMRRLDSRSFVELVRASHALAGIEIGDDVIEDVEIYPTGHPENPAPMGALRYRVYDKYGKAHDLFNLRGEVAMRSGRRIPFGLDAGRLDGFEAEWGAVAGVGEWYPV